MRARWILPALLLVALLGGAADAQAKSSRITFYFGLERNESGATAEWRALTDPASPQYRHLLGRQVIFNRYGASSETIAGLRRVAKRYGMSVKVDKSRVFARVTGQIKEFQRVLGAPVVRAFDNDDNSMGFVVKNGHKLRLQKSFRPYVREIVAFSNRQVPKPGGKRLARRANDPGPKPVNDGTWTGGCAAAQKTGAYSYAQARTAYGLNPLGDGSGASVAMMSAGEGVGASESKAIAKCFGLPTVGTTTILTDGQKKPLGPDSFEPSQDLAMIRGIAPGLSSLTLVQTWEAPEQWFLGPGKLLTSKKLPDVFSISYGECDRLMYAPAKPAIGRYSASLFDALTLRLGLAGVATFAATGDTGSTCDGQPYTGTAWPGSSRYVTAVGGTRLSVDAANTRTGEVAWNDLPWLSTEEGGGAGGGGVAYATSRPSYQSLLPQSGDNRLTPDVSANSSILPGWPTVFGGEWSAVGGTSSATPLVASAFAILDARERTVGAPRLGPPNGLLYSLDSNPGTVFDVTSGNTQVSPKVPGRQAGPGYDLATGIGVLQFTQLATAVPPPGT